MRRYRLRTGISVSVGLAPRPALVAAAFAMLAMTVSTGACGAEESATSGGVSHGVGAEGTLPAEVVLYDTMRSLPNALPGDSVAPTVDWKTVREGETDHQFQGDAAMMNDRLGLVFRRSGPGVELFSRHGDRLARRAVLAPTSGEADACLSSLAVVENSPNVAAIDATFQAAHGKRLILRYELEMGRVYVKTQARQGVGGLRIDAPCRFVILPDFFADDIVADATEIPVAEADLPHENFLLHMLAGGDAILMTVSKSREEDVKVALAGQGEGRRINSSEIGCGRDGEIWVAVMEGRDVWHERDIGPGDAGEVVPLDWTAPYPAQWRVDWRRDDRLTGSWEMIAEKRNGQFEKHGWFGDPNTIRSDRRRWTTVLGWFYYPCWIDRHGRGHLQPLAKKVRFEGPTIIYPINRTRETPLAVFTVVDVVRATLGVGPCEYILDVEGQPVAMKGRATCATRDVLDDIYTRGAQKSERARVEEALRDVLIFVRHIRGRIDAYVDFGHQVLRYLDEQKKAHPELADSLAEMQSLARMIDERFEARKSEIRTPQYVADLVERFRETLLDYEGDDGQAKCKEITRCFTQVGGNQDELVGECRLAVKILRQRAGLAMATDPRVADIAREIRRRTQEVLRNPASYEAPRH